MRLKPPPVSAEEAELRVWLRRFSTEPAALGVATGSQDGPPSRLAGQQQTHPPSVAGGGPAGSAAPQEERLTGIGVAVGAMSPIRPNVIWAMDFQFDTTADGRTLKMLNVIDEFTREALAIEVDRSIDADGVVDVLDRLALHNKERRTTCASTTVPSSWRTP